MTFAEVGGVWGIVNEKTSVAASAGATELTQIDYYREGDPAWGEYRARLKDLKLQIPVDCISCDFQEYKGKAFDVIHSCGVLYHLPDPFRYLARLREKARNHVIFTSFALPNVIENQYGKYEVPQSTAIFVPALTQNERQILNEFWKIPGLLGIGSEAKFTMNDFAPVWWLPTETTLRKMCEIAGFSIQDEAVFWADHATTLLLR
jgi:cyclopropane fatty-acyl-phospholipid synthase-like methyltransferase